MMDSAGIVWNDMLIFDASVAYAEAFGFLTVQVSTVIECISTPLSSIADAVEVYEVYSM